MLSYYRQVTSNYCPGQVKSRVKTKFVLKSDKSQVVTHSSQQLGMHNPKNQKQTLVGIACPLERDET